MSWNQGLRDLVSTLRHFASWFVTVFPYNLRAINALYNSALYSPSICQAIIGDRKNVDLHLRF